MPSYLESAKNFEEKASNFGVLDRYQLENSRSSQKHVQRKSGRHSLSGYNTCPFMPFPVERSPANSSRGRSCSPSHERARQCSLQFHLMSSPKDENPRVDKSFEGSTGTSQVNSASAGHSLFKKHTEIKYAHRKIIDSSYTHIKTSDKRVNSKDTLTKTEKAAKDGEFIHKAFGFGAASSGVPRSCHVLPNETERLQSTNYSPGNRESLSLSRDRCLSVPRAATIGRSHTHGMSAEVKITVIGPECSTLKKCSVEGDVILKKVTPEKPRSTSPFARLGIGMSKIRKNFTSKDGSSRDQPSSTHDTPRSASTASTSCQPNSSCDTKNGNSRARSSPLRRLLDPLLKPKAPSFRLPQDPLQRDSVSRENAGRLSHGKQIDLSTNISQPGIAKVEMTRSRALDNKDSSSDEINRPSTSQALLRVAIKNGQPLFTFAVNNESDVLAATMKNLSKERNYSCVYTFFAIQEVKKKNGRLINQSSKEKNNDYAPNIVAQLKVSCSEPTTMNSHNHNEQSFAREYILFDVDRQQTEQQALDLQPNNELSAIIVKFLKGSSQRRANIHSEPVTGTGDLLSVTAILPSGVHSLPSRGGPSSLIQRWRSGGSCDCGGWDLGCKLRILANTQSPHSEKSGKSDKFGLIPMGGDQLVFNVAPFKDGTYSVEFSSTILDLQAFSLCIAVLDNKNLYEVSKSSGVYEEKVSRDTTMAQNSKRRTSNGLVSYPPHSPVGRA